jgi:hypothetical protein
MPAFRSRPLATLALVAACSIASAGRVLAQGTSPTAASSMPASASQVRDEFREVMRRYPPSLGQVLKLDPTLLSNETYLAPYPTLVAFAHQHPEVVRQPDYFLSFVYGVGPTDPDTGLRQQTIHMWENAIQELFILVGFATAVLTFAWLVRSFIAHRRWLRATRLQSEVQGRLFERMGSGPEVTAFLESPAGRHLLDAPAIPTEAGPPPATAPFSRVLWGVQAGLVLAAGGVGLLIARSYIIEEAGQLFLVAGVLVLSLGVGFVLAATASYVLSARLGFLERQTSRLPGAGGE